MNQELSLESKTLKEITYWLSLKKEEPNQKGNTGAVVSVCIEEAIEKFIDDDFQDLIDFYNKDDSILVQFNKDIDLVSDTIQSLSYALLHIYGEDIYNYVFENNKIEGFAHKKAISFIKFIEENYGEKYADVLIELVNFVSRCTETYPEVKK